MNMKRVLFFASALLLMALTACSNDDEQVGQDSVEPVPAVKDDSTQATYLPMFKEGRVWNCMEVHSRGRNDTVMYSYRVKGTDVIDGHSCYVVSRDNGGQSYFYEDGPKVYFHASDPDSPIKGWNLIYDFSAEVGQKVHGGYTVTSIDTISFGGFPHRRLGLGVLDWDMSRQCLIEGIGCTNHLFNYTGDVIGSLCLDKLLTVYDGDKCIYDCLYNSPGAEHEAIDLSDSNVKLSVKPKSELARVKVNIRYESNQNADAHFFDNTRLFVRSVNFSGLSFSDGRKDGKEGSADGKHADEPNQYLNPAVTENYAPVSNGKFGSEKNAGIIGQAQPLFAFDNDDEGYFYVIPRQHVTSIDLYLTYYIETIDSRVSALLSDGETHGMLIESTIGKENLFGQNFDFEAGKSYVINIVLGSEKPKMEVFVSDWP
jgi:hypothetical protein